MRTYTVDDLIAVRRADKAAALASKIEDLLDLVAESCPTAAGKERAAYTDARSLLFDAMCSLAGYAQSVKVPSSTPAPSKKTRVAV